MFRFSKIQHTSRPSTPGLFRVPSQRLRISLLIALIAAATWYLLNQYPSTSQAIQLATTRQAEPFTELYFENPAKLPKNLTPKKDYVIHFHITNHQGQTITYPYRVTLVTNGTPTVLQTGQFELHDTQGTDQAITIRGPASGKTVEVIVELPDQQQSIHFKAQS